MSVGRQRRCAVYFNHSLGGQKPYCLHEGLMQWKQMTARTSGDIVIVDLKGNMCLCGEDELPAFVSELLERGFRKYILNLLELPAVDSSGLSGLVRSYVAVKERAGRLVLLHVHLRIRELFEVTKLVSIFDTYDSEEEALRSFGGSEFMAS